jgi:hypothetical protein
MDIQPSNMTEDGVLQLVEGIRLQGVKDIVATGYPKDKEERDHLKELLAGLDKSALTRKRIKVDEGGNAALANGAGLVAELLTKMSARRPTVDISDAAMVQPPVLGEDVPPPVLVPGEIDTAPEALNYDSFMARHSNSSSLVAGDDEGLD